MKGLLLAAGFGSRLRPLTFRIPKCLVPVKGLPVLGHWLHLLEKHGYKEVLINTGYQAKQVKTFLDTFYSPIKIHLTHERFLLGTGGTLKANWNFFKAEERFLVAHVDNLTNANLSEFQSFSEEKLSSEIPATMGLFRSPKPRECGIVEMNNEGLILKFHEKVENPPGDLANAGIYMFHNSIGTTLNRIKNTQIDLCQNVLTRLEGRMMGWSIGDAFLLDIGNMDAYERANLDPLYKLQFPPDRTDVRELIK